MFKLLSPQRAANSDGFIVQVASREAVEYIEGAEHYRVEVDFGQSVGVYERTLKFIDGRHLPQDRAELIIGRIVEGLHAMGCETELC